ncbi:MAG: tetratricopeptide repeat protein [Clostridiales bacterium]|nr:tetratricopeptide repeat protein [Clostridiales bacterium]
MDKAPALFDIHTHEFDIAVSFPGEHRAYVRAVVDALIKEDKIEAANIFYDEFYQAFLAIPSSDTLLQDIYRNRSKLIVAFLCEDYQKKEWCGLEARAIRDLIKERQHNSIMLIRMDDGKVAGFFGIDGWIDARKHQPAEIANYINQRLTGKLIFPVSAKEPTLPTNNLPDRNPHFTGREEILEEIHNNFQTGQTVSLRQTVAGLGGVGKTQTAIEYAYRYAGDYNDIWWVNAENGPQEAYRDFAKSKALLPALEEAGWPAVLEAVKNWFDQNEPFLFIYDNAEDFDLLTDCLPRFKGHVLITTRQDHSPLGKSVDITVFRQEEATAFISERLGCDEGKDAAELAKRLGYLPLALEQAVAYITATHESCGDYLQLLEKYGNKLFDERASTVYGYAETVNTTWRISFDKIKSKSAKQLLNLCSYMAADKIPLSLLIKGLDELPEPLRIDLADKLSLINTVLELTRYSLVQKKEGLLSLHRLVQEVVRDGLAEDTQWLSCCLDLAYAVFEYEWGNKQSMDAFSQNTPHILEIARQTEQILGDNEEAQKKAAWLYNEVGRGYNHEGQYQKALKWYKMALAIKEDVLGTEHPDTATTYGNIAGVYGNLGEYAKALEKYRKALAIYEKVLGMEHSDTAATYNNIASVYSNQGKYVKALEWHLKGLVIYEKVLGTEHPNTAVTYNSIAIVYHNQGKYDKALEWCQKALAIIEKVLGTEHPDTASTYNIIAGVYRQQGEYDKAMEWHRKALAIRKKVLSMEHPNTATTYNNIASVYCNQGEYEKALVLYRKALDIFKKVPGTGHPKTAATYYNIALVYSAQGNNTTALEWFSKSYRIRLHRLGEEHPDTIATKNCMETTYKKSGLDGTFEKWIEKMKD